MNDKSSKDSQNKKPELKTPPVRPIQVAANTKKPASNRSIKKKKTIGKPQSKWDGKDCPIWQEKEDIISAISTHKIVVLTAPPATGKSTQLPLMMLEAGFKRVVLVVPRYIIADQLKNDISRLLEGKKKKVTLFNDESLENDFAEHQVIVMTAEQALKFNLVNKLEQKNVLILDEIHQWSEEQEALNGLVTQQVNQKKFRCIVTSATLYSSFLVGFYNQHIGEQAAIELEACKDKKEDTIKDLTYSEFSNISDFNENRLLTKRNKCIQQAITYCIKQNYDVLIFCSGLQDIKSWKKAIQKYILETDSRYKVFPVHGRLKHQEKIKAVTHTSSPKILLSTNILETGLNLRISKKFVGDLAVIDLLEKYETRFDPETNVEELRNVRISKAEQKQRRGRTGRETNGICIAIPPAKNKEFLDYLGKDIAFKEPPNYPIPAIERQELSKIVLRLKKYGVNLEDIRLFHSPKRENIAKAIENLQAIDCLNEREEITSLGRIAAGINLSPSAARIVIEAITSFSDGDLHDDALLVACILDKRGIIDRHNKIHLGQDKSPEWIDFLKKKGKDFKSDLIFQKYLLKNKLNALNRKDKQKLTEEAKKLQLSYPQIEKVTNAYRSNIKKISDWRKNIKLATQNKRRAELLDELKTNEDKLRYCVFKGLPMWLCHSSDFHIDEFVRKGKLQPEIKYHNYLPYDFDSSSTDWLEFQPDKRQCLLGHNNKNIPKWIIANRIKHLENPTFSLYTEVDSSWVEALSEKLDRKRNAVRRSSFDTQDNYIWHTIQFLLFNDAVLGIEKIHEEKEATPYEILTEGVRHRRVNIERILNYNEENISRRLKNILQLGRIEIGRLVEGSVRGVKGYGVHICIEDIEDIGVIYALLSHSDVSNNSISNLHDLFKVNDEIKSIIIDIIPELERIYLSTKVLELSPGDILQNRSSIMSKAEETASRYYSDNENLLNRKNEIVRSKLLIVYVTYKLYQIIQKLRKQDNSNLENMSDCDLLIKLCGRWAVRFPQITLKEEWDKKIVNQEFSEIAEYLSLTIPMQIA